MNRELKKKLTDEQPLTVEETLRLDEAIEGQTVVPALLAGLDDTSPSLAWRSELNQKLLLQSGRHKRHTTFRWFSGVAAAAALVAVAFLSVPRPTKTEFVREPLAGVSKPAVKEGPSVEESLLTAHREADLESGMGISFDGPSDSKPGSL
jgi:hypothetical protein